MARSAPLGYSIVMARSSFNGSLLHLGFLPLYGSLVVHGSLIVYGSLIFSGFL